MNTAGKCVCCLAGAALCAATAMAENVVVKIRAVNPAESKQTVRVSTRLPSGIDPNLDVVDTGGMELRYDAKAGVYFAETEVVLDPHQTRDFAVSLRDIWTISPETITELGDHAAKLTAKLAGTKRGQTAMELKRRVEMTLAQLTERQQRFDFDVASARDHVQAHEKNRELMDQARADAAMLENLAVGEGIDPVKLRGLPPPLPKRAKAQVFIGDTPLVKRIQISNPSQSKRAIPMKIYLPQEVLPGDVDAGESLEVRWDDERSMCYITRDDVMVDAGKTIDFQILVTNKWVLDPARLAELETRATNLQAQTAGRFQGFRTEAEDIVRRLDKVKTEKSPEELNENYIAFHRRQVKTVDDIERSVLRLEDYMRPGKAQDIIKAQILEKVQPPSRTSTWIIIYIILGFLAVVSILFFLRWYGKSVDEKMADRVQ